MIQAVLFDRDGTLIEDVPYNGDPALVVLRPFARSVMAALRSQSFKLAVVSNQSGVGRGLIDMQQVHSVNARVEELLGWPGPWLLCPHAPADGCKCRKPSPALLLKAAETLQTVPAACCMIGDKKDDMLAARNAGMLGILVPSPATTPDAASHADHCCDDLSVAGTLIFTLCELPSPVLSPQ